MYRLFEGKESTDELAWVFSFSAAVGFGFIALMNVPCLIGSLVVMQKRLVAIRMSGNFNAATSLTGALAGRLSAD
jgi:hypothetical protein